MKMLIGVSLFAVSMALSPAAWAESSCPADQTGQMVDQLPEKCRAELDSWAATQPESSVDVEGNVVVGTVLADSVTVTEVPAYKHYGYVVVNNKRVLVDRNTRTIIKVY